jgi:hypothetical protein
MFLGLAKFFVRTKDESPTRTIDLLLREVVTVAGAGRKN